MKAWDLGTDKVFVVRQKIRDNIIKSFRLTESCGADVFDVIAGILWSNGITPFSINEVAYSKYYKFLLYYFKHHPVVDWLDATHIVNIILRIKNKYNMFKPEDFEEE